MPTHPSIGTPILPKPTERPDLGYEWMRVYDPENDVYKWVQSPIYTPPPTPTSAQPAPVIRRILRRNEPIAQPVSRRKVPLIPDDARHYTPPVVTGTPPVVTPPVRRHAPAPGIMPHSWMPPRLRDAYGRRRGRQV